MHTKDHGFLERHGHPRCRAVDVGVRFAFPQQDREGDDGKHRAKDPIVLHVGLDLSRKRVDVCVISGGGELLGEFPAPADRDGLHALARRQAAYGQPVRGVVESMNGARFVTRSEREGQECSSST
jgi:hypothetical protein